MKKKTGFTLIELLAVIVILAVIALIAVPVIMNIIDKANKSAFKDTAYAVLSAGELYFAEQQLELNGMSADKTFTLPSNELQIKGNVPKGTILKVNAKGETALTMTNGRYCITKEYTDKDITLSEDLTNCNIAGNVVHLSDVAVEAPELGVEAVHECAVNGGCEPGTAFAIKVNEEETYKFYVLKEEFGEIELIMASNVYSKDNPNNPNVEWINETDYNSAGGEIWNEWRDNTLFGPITALRALKERTSGWTNIPEYSYDLDFGPVTIYNSEWNEITIDGKYSGEYVQNVRTKLPERKDMANLSYELPSWAYEGLYETGDNNTFGYWLVEPVFDTMPCATTVEIGGYIGRCINVNDTERGIRPVITFETKNKLHTNGIMASENKCITEGKCTPGTEIKVQVNDNTAEKFYVLSDNGEKLNLILNRNLGANVAWNSNDIYTCDDWKYDMDGDGVGETPGGNCYYSNSFGPITALKTLKERTSGWTNIDEYSYELNYGPVYFYKGEFELAKHTDRGTYSGEYVQNVRARLPKLSDVTSEGIGCIESYSDVTCPSWIYDNLDNYSYEGYWLSDASSSVEYAYVIRGDGLLAGFGEGLSDLVNCTAHGLRPVITITK